MPARTPALPGSKPRRFEVADLAGIVRQKYSA
jgi:hypothetical protein